MASPLEQFVNNVRTMSASGSYLPTMLYQFILLITSINTCSIIFRKLSGTVRNNWKFGRSFAKEQCSPKYSLGDP